MKKQMEVVIRGNVRHTLLNGLNHSFNDNPSKIVCNNYHFDDEILMHDDIPYDVDSIERYWHKNGQIHRDNDLPATITPNAQGWYQNNNLHRDNGPALVTLTQKMWFKNGILHRDDGPAVIHISGRAEWWQNGEQTDTCDGYIETSLMTKSAKK